MLEDVVWAGVLARADDSAAAASRDPAAHRTMLLQAFRQRNLEAVLAMFVYGRARALVRTSQLTSDIY
jgi:hypothetical protein